jgi:hypothetical protein
MPSNPGEEPAGKELIASGTFCSFTIKEKSPVLKASGEKTECVVKTHDRSETFVLQGNIVIIH